MEITSKNTFAVPYSGSRPEDLTCKVYDQYGVETVTIQNLEVVKVDPELNMLVVRGAVPGPKGSLVTVKTTVKVHKIKQAGADISKNPQKASGRNPQKASARNM